MFDLSAFEKLYSGNKQNLLWQLCGGFQERSQGGRKGNKQEIQNRTYMNELEQDKRYVFGDMIIVATTDFDFNPILKISTDDGNVIVMPSSDNKIIVKSTVDK